MTISPAASLTPRLIDDEIASFEQLKSQLRELSRRLRSEPALNHTSVVVPSLSVDQEELTKVSGAAYYEERLLFTLIRLRSPGARVIYLTSQPIHPDTVDYYLQLLIGVPASHAKRRLLLLSMQDGSAVPLTQKILERPRVMERLKSWIGERSRAYITCFNSTHLERRLAVELGIPLYGADPELLRFGTKSGSREVFREAAIDLPDGAEDLSSEDEVVHALAALHQRHPQLRKAVVKINEGFSGEGNAIFHYPTDGTPDTTAIRDALHRLDWSHAGETYERFFRKFADMGGIVEEFIDGPVVRSPSTQLRIQPDGNVQLISTHDQVLGAATGQVYLGGRFPADAAYRQLIQSEGLRVGEVLSRHGVVGRFGIDFMVVQDTDGRWSSKAVEINLRMGGTTPPFMALELLAPGELDAERGEYLTAGGKVKSYYATDNLKSPAYRGLLPEDLLDLLTEYGIRFDPSTGTGVLFYMIGALSEYGKLGVVSIGNSREEADQLYERTVAILDLETGGDTSEEHLHPLFDHRGPSME